MCYNEYVNAKDKRASAKHFPSRPGERPGEGRSTMDETKKKLQRADELLKAVERSGKIDYALGYLNGMADTEAMHQAKAEKNA